MPDISHVKSRRIEQNLDKEIIEELRQLQETANSQVINSLGENYNTAFFKQNKINNTHIIVKKLDFSIEVLVNLDKYDGCTSTFRISSISNFHSLWGAVCSYWVIIVILIGCSYWKL